MRRINIRPPNWSSLLAVSVFAITGISILFISLSASNSYCTKTKNNDECIDLKFVQIPNNILPSLIGSFTGALFTFCAFYLLEEDKRRAQPKPKIKVDFEPDKEVSGVNEKFRELVVRCEPHYIYLEDKKQTSKMGNACFLRVKVTNQGNIVGRNCRAYLTKIEERGPGAKWKPLKGYEDSMPLLWAFERKEDYFIVGSGIAIPSQASSYADVLVSYEECIIPNFDINRDATVSVDPNLQKRWFLKLKTKTQPAKHSNLFGIDIKVQSEFRLTVEVYADECEPSKIKIILSHHADKEFIYVYDEKNEEHEEYKAELPLYSSIDKNQLPTDVNQIYEWL
jgi:hypothetical protein